jgi:phage terminase large subunit
MALARNSDRLADPVAKPTGGNGYKKLAANNAGRSAAAEAKLGQKFIDTLFAENIRHKALHGGRGSAKSWSVATYLPIRASQTKKRIVCARQFQNSIRDSSKELIEKRIRALGMSNQYTITDRYIIHDGTKSQFMFVGLERNVESIRSLEGADIVWIEEAKTISAKSMEILLPTVRAAGSELIWTWNPDKPTDPVDAYFRKGEPPPRSIVTEVSYKDNPFFENTEMPNEMQVLRDGNFARYQHVWEGAYDISYETKVFTRVRVGRPEVPANTAPYYGMDFGFGSDPSFVVKVFVFYDKKQIYISNEASGRVTMDQLPHMVRSVTREDGDRVCCDSSQPGTIEFLQSRGINAIPAKKGPGSVKSGILFLQGFEIIIDPNCEKMQEEAHLYSWMTDKLTGQALSTPVDAFNHGWDATRYAVEDVAQETALDDDESGGVLKLKLW